MDKLDYKADLTGTAFLLIELKQVIHLQLLGMSDKDIKVKIKNENIFQYRFPSSINRIVPTMIRRANAIENDLKQLFFNNYSEYGKIINLYSIMKTDRLFNEFMFEIMYDKFEKGTYYLEKKDVNIFFTYKAEQNEKIANWTDNTMAKLRQVYLKILLESGILKDLKTGELSRLYVDEQLKNYFKKNHEELYLKCMGETSL